MADNNNSAGKASGKIFCVLAGLIVIAAMLFSSYMSGQKETITDYYTAIIRSEYTAFDKYFIEGVCTPQTAQLLTEEYNALSAPFELASDNIMHVRVDFDHRVMNSIDNADYYFTVTYYDDNIHSHVSELLHFRLQREGMSWKLCSEKPL